MAAPAFGSIGTHSNTSSGTASFAVPAGVASGDIIVIPIFVDSTTTITALPSGFAHAPNSPIAVTTGGGFHSLAVVWKRATGADAGTYDFTLSATSYRAGSAIRYTGCVAAGSPWDATNSAADTALGTVTPAVSVTTTGADRLLFFAGTNWSGGAWTEPTGSTERMDTGDRVNTAADKVQASAGSSGSITATCVGNDRRTAWLGALMPVAGGATVAPDGISVPVALGSPTLTWSGAIAPDGISVPVALGSPIVGAAPVAPDGIAVPVTLGSPTLTWSGAISPDGIAVPVALGSPSVSIPGSVVTRPFTGTVTRPDSGIVTRPDTGVVSRP